MRPHDNNTRKTASRYTRSKEVFLRMRELCQATEQAKRRKFTPWTGKDEPDFEVETPWDGRE